MRSWHETPNLNSVYEALKALTKGGEVPVEEQDLYYALERRGRRLGASELAKNLLILEILGRIHVSTSSEKEKIIRLVK